MRIAIVGNNDGPLTLLKSLKRVEAKPVFIGLQQKLGSELLKKYQQISNDVQIHEGFDEAKLIILLRNLEVDVLINCFCNFIFKDLLDIYNILNIHPSPLPAYRGRHPMHWALLNGEKEFGISIHKMTKKVDVGPILWQEKVIIREDWSVVELRKVLLEKLELSFGEFIRKYETGNVIELLPPSKEFSYFRPLEPEDSLINDLKDFDNVYRKIMALRAGLYPAYVESDGFKIEFIFAEKNKIETEISETNFANNILKIKYPKGYLLYLYSKEKIPFIVKKQIEKCM